MTSLFVAFIVFYIYIYISSLSYNIEVNEYCVVRGSSGHLSLRHVFFGWQMHNSYEPMESAVTVFLDLFSFGIRWRFFHMLIWNFPPQKWSFFSTWLKVRSTIQVNQWKVWLLCFIFGLKIIGINGVFFLNIPSGRWDPSPFLMFWWIPGSFEISPVGCVRRDLSTVLPPPVKWLTESHPNCWAWSWEQSFFCIGGWHLAWHIARWDAQMYCKKNNNKNLWTCFFLG